MVVINLYWSLYALCHFILRELEDLFVETPFFLSGLLLFGRRRLILWDWLGHFATFRLFLVLHSVKKLVELGEGGGLATLGNGVAVGLAEGGLCLVWGGLFARKGGMCLKEGRVCLYSLVTLVSEGLRVYFVEWLAVEAESLEVVDGDASDLVLALSERRGPVWLLETAFAHELI